MEDGCLFVCDQEGDFTRVESPGPFMLFLLLLNMKIKVINDREPSLLFYF